MPRNMLAIPHLAPTQSTGAHGLDAISKAIQLYMTLQSHTKNEALDQAKLDQQSKYQQGELDFKNRQMDVLNADRDEQRNLMTQSRADILAEKSKTGDENLAKWIASNYGGEDLPGTTPAEQKPTVDLFNRAGMSSALESKMTLPSRSVQGMMSGVVPGEGQQPDFASQTTSSAAEPTGLMGVRLTMDDRMRQAAQKASQDATINQFKQDKLTSDKSNFDRKQGDVEKQNSTMNAIRDAQTQAHIAQIKAASLRSGQAQSDRDLKRSDKQKELATKAENARTNASDTVDVIDKLSTHSGLSGIVGNVIPWSLNPKSDAAAALALYDNLTAKNMLGTIAELKSLSSSGATGFGNLSDAEGKILRDAVGALSRKQPIESFQANLNTVREKLAKAAGLPTRTANQGTTGKTYIDPKEF